MIQSLAAFSAAASRHPVESREPAPKVNREYHRNEAGERQSSVLLLRVLAAADYFTDNAGLMLNVTPVYVDIILDPYFLNVVPTSLVTTAGFIMAIAGLSWITARRFASWICTISQEDPSELKKKL